MKLMKFYILLSIIINIYTPSPPPSSSKWFSPCELTENPTSYESCKKRNTEFIYETCCYMEATQNGEYEPECVDVSRDDVRNKEDVEKTRLKILDGIYWEKDDEKYDSIDKLICSSNYILTTIFLLLLIFLL